MSPLFTDGGREMKIGPIGSGGFSDFNRLIGIHRTHPGHGVSDTAGRAADSDKRIKKTETESSVNSRNMDYLERQARNAERAERSLGFGNSFDVSL